MKIQMKSIKYFITLNLALMGSFMLVACSKSVESDSAGKNNQAQLSDASNITRQLESQNINQEQEIFNKKVYDLEFIKEMSDTSTREGDSKYKNAQNDLNILRESIVGKKIANWSCIAFRPLGPIDLVTEYSSFERDGQKTAEVICSGNQHDKFTNDISGTVKQEITLSIYEDSAKKIGKVFNNDKLNFSGIVEEFSSRGPNKYYMKINVESIKLTQAK